MQKKLNEIPRHPDDYKKTDGFLYGAVLAVTIGGVAYTAYELSDFLPHLLLAGLVILPIISTVVVLQITADIKHQKNVRRAAYATESPATGKVIDVKGDEFLILVYDVPDPLYTFTDERQDWLGKLQRGSDVTVKMITRYDAADHLIDYWYDGIESVAAC